jgi:hypothetical protein
MIHIAEESNRRSELQSYLDKMETVENIQKEYKKAERELNNLMKKRCPLCGRM